MGDSILTPTASFAKPKRSFALCQLTFTHYSQLLIRSQVLPLRYGLDSGRFQATGRRQRFCCCLFIYLTKFSVCLTLISLSVSLLPQRRHRALQKFHNIILGFFEISKVLDVELSGLEWYRYCGANLAPGGVR